MKRPRNDRRFADVEPRPGFLGVVADEETDDQFIHQHVVGVAAQDARQAVFLARGLHEHRSGGFNGTV
jgi:hypothetical protein